MRKFAREVRESGRSTLVDVHRKMHADPRFNPASHEHEIVLGELHRRRREATKTA